MKKEKGFTLIELLAVIVILAILMVIAVPKILNVIENSRKSAAESSIKLVKDAIKTQVTSGSIMGTNFTSDESGCYTFNFDDQTSGNAKELQLKNKEKITGTIKYCNGTFSNDSLKFDGNRISKDDTNKKVICKRASKYTLYTETCSQTDPTYYCSGAGLSGQTITYGNTTITENELNSGDAFDCDVNGDGKYDSKTERFYYVSDYYNTSTKEFESDTAVLIYYSNVKNGEPSNSTKSAYDSSGENWHGPRTAIKQLPTTSQWSNVSLKNSVRAILNENSGNTTTGGRTLLSNFSFEGYSARLLTVQEINSASQTGSGTRGELDNCNYLMENTKYTTSYLSYGYWLESACSDSSMFAAIMYSDARNVSNFSVSHANAYGVRPVIEVPKSNIEY